jgi:hypothetical protein
MAANGAGPKSFDLDDPQTFQHAVLAPFIPHAMAGFIPERLDQILSDCTLATTVLTAVLHRRDLYQSARKIMKVSDSPWLSGSIVSNSCTPFSSIIHLMRS